MALLRGQRRIYYVTARLRLRGETGRRRNAVDVAGQLVLDSRRIQRENGGLQLRRANQGVIAEGVKLQIRRIGIVGAVAAGERRGRIAVVAETNDVRVAVRVHEHRVE